MGERITIDRRTLLAGWGAALSGGFFGGATVAPTLLPPRIVEFLAGLYPTPPNRPWRPEITQAHADQALQRFENLVDRADELQERVDFDAVDGEAEFYVTISPGGGHLDNARQASSPRERLHDVMSGLPWVGKTIGAAKYVLDEYDVEGLIQRGERIQSDLQDVRQSLGEYPVSNPRRDLALLHELEHEVAWVSDDLPRSLPGVGDDDATNVERGVIRAWDRQVAAEQELRNARYYRNRYRENLGDDPRPFADDLRAAIGRLRDEADELPTREDMYERVRSEMRLGYDTPYGVARNTLLQTCFNTAVGYLDDDADYPVLRAVELARELLARRAHDFALSRLAVSEGDTGYHPGRTYRAQRRALRQFRTVREEYDSPLAGLLAQNAASLVPWTAGVEPSDQPSWRKPVEFAVYAYVSIGMMRELGDVIGIVLDGEV